MIAIVHYGMGNAGSIKNMLARLGAESVITAEPEVLDRAGKLILPGVGSFDSAVEKIEALGLLGALDREVLERGKPVLGICLGMQLLCKRSEEGTREGLGWLDAEAIKFRFPEGAKLRVPHMGWNTLKAKREHPLLEGMFTDHRFYFAHSYHVRCNDPDDVLASTDYGFQFTSMAARGNIMGTQFHPEKSHKFGLKLLGNFARI